MFCDPDHSRNSLTANRLPALVGISLSAGTNPKTWDTRSGFSPQTPTAVPEAGGSRAFIPVPWSPRLPASTLCKPVSSSFPHAFLLPCWGLGETSSKLLQVSRGHPWCGRACLLPRRDLKHQKGLCCWLVLSFHLMGRFLCAPRDPMALLTTLLLSWCPDGAAPCCWCSLGCWRRRKLMQVNSAPPGTSTWQRASHPAGYFNPCPVCLLWDHWHRHASLPPAIRHKGWKLSELCCSTSGASSPS